VNWPVATNAGDRTRQIWNGRQAIQARQFNAARAIAVQVLSRDPRDIDALEIKAIAEIERGNDKDAEQTLRAAVLAAPKVPWPYAGLAELLLRAGRAAEAEQVCRAALAIDPRNSDAHAKLADLLANRMKGFDAAEHYRLAIDVEGPVPHLLIPLGHALLRLGLLEKARETLEAAAKADRNAFGPAIYLAELEEREGNFEAAMQQLERAEELGRPRGLNVDRQRSVLLARMGQHEAALALLEAKAEISGAELLHRGRLRERAGRHAEAWSDWKLGKEKLASAINRPYPSQAVSTQARRLASFFASPAAAELPRAKRREDVPQPIFIVGSPRSGTTLTERILASHSAVVAGGELPFGVELQEFAVSLAGGEWSFPEGLARAQPDWATKLRDRYLAEAERYGLLASSAPYFTDKMPTNDFWLPLLRLAFPDSPAVLVRRHPLDVLTSIMAHEMTHGFNSSYRLEDAARHLALADDLMEKYRAAGFGPTYDLRYETLVANQAEETERLTAAVGLEMEPSQLNFHESGPVPATPSYAQVRKPLNAGSIGNWRNYASELEAVRPPLADVLARGGYTD
jgi:tetratricopeptide (TPR) repeat protein